MDLWKEIIPRINNGDIDWILALTDEQIKKIPTLIVMRAIASSTGAANAISTISINEIANHGFYQLKDRRLQLLLLAICGDGKRKSYIKSKKDHEEEIINFILKCHPTYNYDDAETYMKLSSNDDLLELGLNAGMQDKEFKKWQELVKKR